MIKKIFTVTSVAAIALTTAGCQDMMGSRRASATPSTASAAQAEQKQQEQALAPDLVRDIQRNLNAKGYNVGAVDGVYGDTTQAAIDKFQRDNALPGNGQINRQTLAALGITGLTAGTESQQRQQTAAAPPTPAPLAATAGAPGQKMSPDMVRNIQGELQRQGYNVGQADGKWGPRTRRALRQFQRDRQLAATGRLDERTLAALEAGGATPQTGQLPAQPRTRQQQQQQPR